MNYKEVAAQAGVTETQARTVTAVLADAIVAECRTGKRVTISGLGSFTEKGFAGRTGFNPRTREPIVIQPKRAIRFKASPKTDRDA
jgi:DNA-binding protein HU-beta